MTTAYSGTNSSFMDLLSSKDLLNSYILAHRQTIVTSIVERLRAGAQIIVILEDNLGISEQYGYLIDSQTYAALASFLLASLSKDATDTLARNAEHKTLRLLFHDSLNFIVFVCTERSTKQLSVNLFISTTPPMEILHGK